MCATRFKTDCPLETISGPSDITNYKFSRFSFFLFGRVGEGEGSGCFFSFLFFFLVSSFVCMIIIWWGHRGDIRACGGHAAISWTSIPYTNNLETMQIHFRSTAAAMGKKTKQKQQQQNNNNKSYFTAWFPTTDVVAGATRGVTVSMSAFLTCHQCYCAGSSLAWGLNLRAWFPTMWHFLKLVARGFLRVLRFPPLLHRFNDSANKIKLK